MYSDPLAYFLTWSTYGSHLHFDDRGSVDRHHNSYGSPRLQPHPGRESFGSELLREPVFRLSDDARRVVEEVVGDHCRIRRWGLIAVNARTEHVHVIVSATNVHPDLVLEQLQAWGTRRLRERGFAGENQQVWTRKGSTRYLFNQRSLEDAIHYVVNEQ